MASKEYRDFYCACLGTLEVYRNTVAEYQREVDILKHGLRDYRNSPMLVKEYRKNLRSIKRRMDNYKQRMICLTDIFNRNCVKEHA